MRWRDSKRARIPLFFVFRAQFKNTESIVAVATADMILCVLQFIRQIERETIMAAFVEEIGREHNKVLVIDDFLKDPEP